MLHATEKSCDLSKFEKPFANSEDIVGIDPKLIYLGPKKNKKN